MNLSDYSSEVVGFDSTWDQDKQVLVKDAGTEAMESRLEVSDQSLSTVESKDVGIQATPTIISNSNEETDRKLAAWLKKILPALEKELEEGPTPVYNNNSNTDVSPIKIEEYQDIELKKYLNHEGNQSDSLIKGTATWLSVSTLDSPVLALSYSVYIDDQMKSFVLIFEPKRSKSDAKIYWQELTSIPVKEPIEFLVTNPQNRDMFAGGSTSGDLYVWNYQNIPSKESESRVAELFSKSSEDTLVALTFMNDNKILCCQNDGKILIYKIVSKQNTTVDKIMRIKPRNTRDPLITCIASVPGADDDFIVGLLNGTLLYCSSNQLMHQEGEFNPIIRELNSHKFSISSLISSSHSGKSYIISCDLSGEIFFHEVAETFMKPKLVVKLPLPMKKKISCLNNMEHIFCPLDNGTLEVFRTSSNIRETVIEGKLDGCGNVVELSRNESWLVTGIYNGTFKIYHILNDE
ncbi:CLUMA_CG015176, isoform A [Clunio marinus]|uniref:CLUMA_CG015176, isoform A n=1 Tax=Clunio marinus TaxID=568069 RepID=A0A1J1IRX2_9DIPT|nr:CLUMA_CG015176, isoform A [Clunio marinus]